MDERRRFGRFDTQLEAQYFIKDKKGGSGKCTIIDVSRKGMGIKFSKHENIHAGSNIHLEVTVPTELEPIGIRGVLRHIKQRGDDFIGSVELNEVLDEVTFGRLG
jgi:c-di-GMP-binding flagellar brake protein YcgR